MNATPITIRHILVAHDFSDTAARAYDVALDLAKKLDAHVTVLHAYEFVTYGYAEGVVIAADIMKQLHAAAQAALEALVARSKDRGVNVAYELRMGVPRAEIVDFARKANVDLIVLGTHGRTGLSHLLLGSVAESVVRTAPCPVLTVPGPKGTR